MKAAYLCESHDIKLFYTIKLGRKRETLGSYHKHLFTWSTGLKMRRI